MVKVIVILLILIIALYFGSGGFIILENELNYENAKALEKDEVIIQGITFHRNKL